MHGVNTVATMLPDARYRVNLLRLYLALDRSSGIRFSFRGFLTMKTSLRYSLAGLLILAAVGLAFADEFKSMVVPGDGTATAETLLPRVHGDQFMLIRNFTQEDGTTRGVVTIRKPNATTGTPINVMQAALLNQSSVPEIINSVIIAGPADVSVTCGATINKNCFISFKKGSN